MAKVNPFDVIGSINKKTEDPFVEFGDYKGYPAFMVNRGLSYHSDSIMFANMMNERPTMDNEFQYKFLFYVVPKRSRYGKWAKKDKASADVAIISKYYGISHERAKEAHDLMTKEQIKTIKEQFDIGGR